ncbi:uncharacterized protein EDB91DRAFT_191052 [Suillus paluster]|uniref:uncharacterized protein n=1 Tax=Suillus paluster TaxID=48578 RepID=UPI001B86FECF|nr:uncharacterized protein EDB91DRAFT_191052 [Suillus paluster]KAG1744567.1 hypothetical protein EDB91DRAFT_191052 [Suillus paluster]
MHQALLVTEILLDIFAHVNQIPNPSSALEKSFKLARQSLAALAVTCKTFHEPAMDLLWANTDVHWVEPLEPLLGCVPRLHPMIYRRGATYNWSEDVDPLSEHEAHQFLRHAARVRSLRISFHVHLHLLSVLPIETCVFPRLRSLIWESNTDRNLGLFLSHTLRHCSLSAINESLKCIVTRSTALMDLSIRCFDESTADELSLLSDSICLCKQLVTLSCPLLDWAALVHLSNLPTLRTVIIHKRNRVPLPLDLNNLTFTPFLHLTTLAFHLDRAAYIITVMQHSEFPSLKQFEMIVDILPWAEAEHLFYVLSQCAACQTLEKIDIHSIRQGLHEHRKSLTVVTQFLCFTQLRTLKLILPCSIFLDDDLLLEAMSSWPHIRSLEIVAVDPPAIPTVTFRGLFAALRRWPHLHTLQLLVNVENIDIDPTAESFQHTTLRALDLITASHIADAKAVARIIFSMLPCVDKVNEFAVEWQKVNMHLKAFKASALLGRQVSGAASRT